MVYRGGDGPVLVAGGMGGFCYPAFGLVVDDYGCEFGIDDNIFEGTYYEIVVINVVVFDADVDGFCIFIFGLGGRCER